MRFVGLIVVVAIVYVCFYRGTDKQSPAAKVAEAQNEAAAVDPPAPAQKNATSYTASNTAPPSSSNSLKAPIDRTRAVLEKVKVRNEE